ncbi:MAG: adenylate/guanylate cyclase domain-containing protein [Acidobacteria bacterium]|nr:adenylate/guanylate cyclase domain-containing protein [Acidobacteriota bacterium]MCL5287794.1 adenylate/guanylate cyclase domain-containing protein [Acidobacteriota bacterium]
MAANFMGKFLGVFRNWWKHKGSLAISLVITVLSLGAYQYVFVGESHGAIADFISRMELASLDTRFRLRGTATPDPRIVIVAIDQRSQEVLGRWPFPRSNFAKMLDVLREDGARVATFDVTYSKPDESSEPIRKLRAQLEEQQKQGAKIDPKLLAEIQRFEQETDYDKKFAEAIERFPKVVLGNFFLYQNDMAGLDAATLDLYAHLLAYFPYPQARATQSARGDESLRNLIKQFEDLGLLPQGAQANMPLFTDALNADSTNKASGFFNVFPDPDGVVRRAPLAIPYGRSKDRTEWDLYASIDVQTIRFFLNLPLEKIALNWGETGVESLEFGASNIVIPDEIGRMMINYQGPTGSYKYFSIADVVNKNFAPGTFKDKIVLIGATATGIGDLRTTPFGQLDYPGVEIHANVIDNILNQKFLTRQAEQVTLDMLLIFLFGIPLGMWLALTQPKWMALGLLLLVPFTGLVQYSFTHGAWLNFVVPGFALVSNTGLVALYRVLIEEKEKRKVRGAFQQYLSPEVIRRLLENPDLVKPRKTELSIMFSDIRGFTTISERLDAQELANLLNIYLGDMTRIVFRNQGTLDKYIGDAVMAFWGAPFEEAGHGVKACRAALQMMQRLSELQKEWKAKGYPHLDIGLGINSGIASVGNMGSDLRYGYTAMGDSVNLASRLEGLNKEYGTHIILSETAYNGSRAPDFLFRELDLIRVKGKLQPVTIYELVSFRDGARDLFDLVEIFGKGRACYKHRDWRQAQGYFEKALQRWPDDGPSKVFFQRCEEYLLEEPASDWDGVYVMKHK